MTEGFGLLGHCQLHFPSEQQLHQKLPTAHQILGSPKFCNNTPSRGRGLRDIRAYRDMENLSNLLQACAPRYVHFTNGLDKREPVGSCWVLRNAMADIKEVAPCRARELKTVTSHLYMNKENKHCCLTIVTL